MMNAQHLQVPSISLHLCQPDFTRSLSALSLISFFSPVLFFSQSCFKFPFASCLPSLQRAVLSVLPTSEDSCSDLRALFSFVSSPGLECERSRLLFSPLSLFFSFFSFSSSSFEVSFGDLQSSENGRPRNRTIHPLIRRAPLHVSIRINFSMNGLKTSIPAQKVKNRINSYNLTITRHLSHGTDREG